MLPSQMSVQLIWQSYLRTADRTLICISATRKFGAYIAAYDATADHDFLLRAQRLAKRFAADLATSAGGLIWEHYHSDWSIDWDYNRDKSR